MKRIAIAVMFVAVVGTAVPAEAGVLRWVAHQTWRCPVIKGAVKGAAKGAVEGAKAALEASKVVAGLVY